MKARKGDTKTVEAADIMARNFDRIKTLYNVMRSTLKGNEQKRYYDCGTEDFDRTAAADEIYSLIAEHLNDLYLGEELLDNMCDDADQLKQMGINKKLVDKYYDLVEEAWQTIFLATMALFGELMLAFQLGKEDMESWILMSRMVVSIRSATTRTEQILENIGSMIDNVRYPLTQAKKKKRRKA